jgi:hypothetical protein
MKLKFSRLIWGSTHIPNFTKILPVGAEFFFHLDKRTGMTKVTGIFLNSANAPKNNDKILCHVINDASRDKLALQKSLRGSSSGYFRLRINHPVQSFQY